MVLSFTYSKVTFILKLKLQMYNNLVIQFVRFFFFYTISTEMELCFFMPRKNVNKSI